MNQEWKSSSLERLHHILKERHPDHFQLSNDELWFFFLCGHITNWFLPKHFTSRRNSWLSFILQPFFIYSSKLIEDLVEEVFKTQDLLSSEELLHQFLEVAGSDERYILIELLHELMSAQTRVTLEHSLFFINLVKGRGEIEILEHFRQADESRIIKLGSAEDNDLRLPASGFPEYCAQIEVGPDQYVIRALPNSCFYIKGQKYQEFEGNRSFLEFQIGHIEINLLYHQNIIFYE
ncbi:MAG: hypothetical protein HQM12_18560, partial [SAR324 cluster bacterium]|nr:hypothetical protein [SAR324 cluster bacterium]